jgi:hypothetical protein
MHDMQYARRTRRDSQRGGDLHQRVFADREQDA